jgi:hypothetical protein
MIKLTKTRRAVMMPALVMLVSGLLVGSTSGPAEASTNCQLSGPDGLGVYWSACYYTSFKAVHWVHVVCTDGENMYDQGGYHPAGSNTPTYSSGINPYAACFPSGWDGTSIHFHVAPAS